MKITEQQIAEYLIGNPDFFVRHQDMVALIKLQGRNENHTISLHDRQVQILRDRIKGFEHNLTEMMRMGRENDKLQLKLRDWLVEVLQAPKDHLLPFAIIQTLKQCFDLPQIVIRLWHVAPSYAQQEYTADVTENDIIFASSMQEPYCGPNEGLHISRWFPYGSNIRSNAILPLKLSSGVKTQSFGLLIFGSMDITRFEVGMSNDLLQSIADLTSAMLCFMHVTKQ